LLIQADNHADAATAQAVYRAVKSFDADTEWQRIEFLTSSAVFHAAFGDATKVPHLLNELVELGRRITQPVVRAVVLRRASWGLCRFGARPLAREVLGEAIAVFDRLRLPSQLALCLEHLFSIDLQEGDYLAASGLLSRVHELGLESPGFYLSAIEYDVRVRLAFETDSRTPLEEFHAPPQALTPFSRAPRTHLHVSALQLGDALLRGPDADVRRSLSVVERLHPALKNRCDQDFVQVVLATGLTRIGRRADAVLALEEYLRGARREFSFLLPSLAKLASELGVPIPKRLSRVRDEIGASVGASTPSELS
jgi:hypothetical protein